MIKQYSILIISLFFSLTSCSQNRTPTKEINTTSLRTYTIDPTKVRGAIESKTVLENIRFIKLETRNECVLGAVSKVFIIDNKIFVFSSSNSLVYCFSNEGKFLFTLNKKGKGPDETGDVRDFAIDAYNKKVILSDSQKRNLFFYSLEGKYLNKLSFDFFVYDLISLSSKEIVLRTSESRGLDLKLYNADSKSIIYEAIKLSQFDDICSGMDFFSSYGDAVLFAPSTRDTIYELTNREIKAKYNLDFGKYSLSKKVRSESSGKVVFNYYKNSKFNFAGFVKKVWETPYHIGFNYWHSKNPRSIQAIVNKKNGTITQFHDIIIDGQIVDCSKFFSKFDNQIYGIIDPVSIAGLKSKKVKPYGIFSSLSQTIEYTSVDDNPIIAVFNLKPNF